MTLFDPQPPATPVPGLHLGKPSTYGPLTVYPVWTGAPLARIRSYTNATARGAEVAELAEGPDVGRLRVHHDGRRPRVLFDGTLLDAGWQHRVVLQDVLVAQGRTEVIDVACVEQGRWGGDRDQRPGRRTAPVGVRGAAMGLRPDRPADAPADADQGDVWRRVDRYERLHGRSATSSLVDVAGRLDAEVAQLLAVLRPLPAQRGVLVCLAGHPVLLEVFDHPRTLAEQWPAILGAAWLDARQAPPVATPGYRARAFVSALERASVQATGAAGAGQQLRIADETLIEGRGLLLGEVLLHATALNRRHEYVLAA
jgi:hypothetical protein